MNPKNDKPSTTLPGTVVDLIPSSNPSAPGKAQIDVEGAEQLYKELRIENTLTDKNGKEVSLKQGAPVDVTVQADAKDTTESTTRTEPRP